MKTTEQYLDTLEPSAEAFEYDGVTDNNKIDDLVEKIMKIQKKCLTNH